MALRNRNDISRRLLLLLAAAALVLRILLTAFQRTNLMPEISMIDDYLAYNAAVHVANGEWLGLYSYLTISKHMLFSLWLALLHKLGIPYLLGGQLLYCVSVSVLVFSLRSVFKKRLHLLFLYVALLYLPTSYANFTLRIYRDNISTSLFLLVFAAVIGFALNSDKRPLVLAGWASLLGFSLGASYLVREDGFWLLPFVAAGLLTAVIRILKSDTPKRLLRIATIAVAVICFALPVGLYAAKNQQMYGRFIVSDLTSPEFTAAYGAITRVRVPEDNNLIVPVPASSREQLYAASPAFAELENALKSTAFSRSQKDCGDGLIEYSGGGFYWAMRNAASLAGHYENAEEAERYFQRVADEVNAACDSGALDATGPRSGLNTPISGRYVMPALSTSMRGIVDVITLRDVDCSPDISVGSATAIAEQGAFTNSPALATALEYNSDSRIVVWAVSPHAPVRITIVDSEGNLAPTDNVVTSGGDVYVSMLTSRGIDLKYSNDCRLTITFAGSPDDFRLVMSDGSQTVTTSLREMPTYAEESGILYRIESVGFDYTETVTYGFAEIWLYRLMRVITFVYKPIMVALFVGGLIALCYTLCSKKARSAMLASKRGVVLLLAAGLLLMGILRIGMFAYLDVSAFGIGLQPMYLAAAYPLFLLFGALSLPCFPRKKHDDE